MRITADRGMVSCYRLDAFEMFCHDAGAGLGKGAIPMRSDTSRLPLVLAALVGGLALFVAGFVIALEVRSVVATPPEAPAAQLPNPGHGYDQIELPPGTWPELDADRLDGLDSSAFAAAGSGACYTNWSGNTCAAGWTAVYTGVWDSVSYANGSYLMCGPDLTPNAFDGDFSVQVDDYFGDNARRYPQNDPCAVCCK